MNGKIVAFCCENSSVPAAETVEKSNPALDAVEIISLPCSGKVEINLILKCLENGASGVLILACPKDGCKYISGNRRAEKRVALLKQSLLKAGIDVECVHMDFLSSVDAHKFIDIVSGMKERLTPGEG